MEEIRIQDKHPVYETLVAPYKRVVYFSYKNSCNTYKKVIGKVSLLTVSVLHYIAIVRVSNYASMVDSEARSGRI